MAQYIQNVQNKNALSTTKWDIVGGYFIFAPDKDSVFYNKDLPINLGHVNKPTETYNPTKKAIDSINYGRQVQIGNVTTALTEGGGFESISVHDPLIRGLWAGAPLLTAQGKPATAPANAAPFQADHAYNAGDIVLPTTPNGFSYTVTTAGNSDPAEPANWTATEGATVNSGGVVFTAHAYAAADTLDTQLILAPRDHLDVSGMLINVVQSAVAGRRSEISVYPSTSLAGAGYGGGRDATNETSLKFEYSIFAPDPNYALPASLGFPAHTFLGGYDILNVERDKEPELIDQIVKGYYGA